MKSVTKISVLLVSLLLSLPAMAQEVKLNQTKAYLKTDKGLKIDYQMSVGQSLSSGTYYALGECFYLESEEIKSWHDGKDLWVYIPQNGEVNLSTPYPEDLLELNPLLNLNALDSRAYKLTETKSGVHSVLRATPLRQNREERIEWLEVTVDAQGRPLSLRIKEMGMRDLITIKVNSLSQEISPEMRQKGFFSFSQNKVPGVAVIDLR